MSCLYLYPSFNRIIKASQRGIIAMIIRPVRILHKKITKRAASLLILHSTTDVYNSKMRCTKSFCTIATCTYFLWVCLMHIRIIKMVAKATTSTVGSSVTAAMM